MTQADIEQARDQVEQRVETTRRRVRRRWALAVAATAAVAVGVGGAALTGGLDLGADPAPADGGPDPGRWDPFLEGEAPTQEAIEGLWRVENGVTLVRFGSDSTIDVDTRGRITYAEVSGTYTLDGHEIVVDLGDEGEPGCTGEVVFRASSRGSGEMRMTLDEPAPAACGFEQSGRWVLEHLLPTRDGDALVGTAEEGDYGALRESVLPGLWLVVGDGYGVELTAGGTYRALGGDGQSIEVGQWWLEGDDLVLQSEKGCSIYLSGVQHTNPGTDMVRGAITEYVCGMPWVSGDDGSTMEWFKIPDRSS